MFTRVVYSSRAAQDFALTDLQSLLEQARGNNAEKDISGALIFVDGVFLQVLEGGQDEVSALMERIARDPRHHDVTVFDRTDIDERAFASWRMAYLTPSAEELAQWAGLDGSVTIDQLLADMLAQPGRLPRVLVSIVETLAEG